MAESMTDITALSKPEARLLLAKFRAGFDEDHFFDLLEQIDALMVDLSSLHRLRVAMYLCCSTMAELIDDTSPIDPEGYITQADIAAVLHTTLDELTLIFRAFLRDVWIWRDEDADPAARWHRV